MRRLFLIATAVLAAYVVAPSISHAQGRPGSGGGASDDDAAAAAKKKKRDEEWGSNQAPLPAMRNAGPCPFVKTLYDAARYVEFKDGKEASGSVAYSGEIQGVSAGCQYKSGDPIKVQMEMLFELGRGSQAGGMTKTYRYWIAVTDRNRLVITRQNFELPVKFTAGQDRVYVTEKIGEITIPRATATTSGSNFEILVGFDVTPEMAAFNRDGKRFRLNAGTAAATAGTDTKSQ